MEYSKSFVGSLIKIPKHIVALALDNNYEPTVVRLKEQSIFLIVDIVDDDNHVPDIWKFMNLYKIVPLSKESYDEFLLPVKSVPNSIFVEANKIFLISEIP